MNSNKYLTLYFIVATSTASFLIGGVTSFGILWYIIITINSILGAALYTIIATSNKNNNSALSVYTKMYFAIYIASTYLTYSILSSGDSYNVSDIVLIIKLVPAYMLIFPNALIGAIILFTNIKIKDVPNTKHGFVILMAISAVMHMYTITLMHSMSLKN